MRQLNPNDGSVSDACLEQLGTDGLAGGDILIKDLFNPAASGEVRSQGLSGVIYAQHRWQNNVLPYAIAPNIPSNIRTSITQATVTWNNSLRNFIKLVPRTTQLDYVVFTGVNTLSNRVCGTSHVGRKGGAQNINLNLQLFATGECDFSTILHELGHAAGLAHEHQRPDRANFIRVYPQNLGQYANDHLTFGVLQAAHARVIGAYNVNSIMHYSSYIGDNTLPWFVLANGAILEDRTTLSHGDVQTLAFLYPPPPTPMPNPNGRALPPNIIVSVESDRGDTVTVFKFVREPAAFQLDYSWIEVDRQLSPTQLAAKSWPDLWEFGEFERRPYNFPISGTLGKIRQGCWAVRARVHYSGNRLSPFAYASACRP